MNLAIFSLKSVFPPLAGRQRSLVFLAAAELGRPALAETALEQHRRPEIALRASGFPKILELLCLKPPFAAKTARFILRNNGVSLYFKSS